MCHRVDSQRTLKGVKMQNMIVISIIRQTSSTSRPICFATGSASLKPGGVRSERGHSKVPGMTLAVYPWKRHGNMMLHT